ncbi:MAG TPA: DUF5666 domain-containing protein [Candidatus Magasanikbacteria bacterium]|nr:DUF5666 domain-containing protein [Candidatus Magasanikbacteria bacterium]
MNKTVGILSVLVLCAGIGGFFGGMQYQKSKGVTQMPNFMSGGGTGMMQQGRMGQGGGARFTGGAGFTSGEILSKDESSMTVKLMDGGSKIVLFSASTTVMKATEVSKDELAVGEQVTVTGATNTDGTVSAQSVQVRSGDVGLPAGMMPPEGAPETR